MATTQQPKPATTKQPTVRASGFVRGTAHAQRAGRKGGSTKKPAAG